MVKAIDSKSIGVSPHRFESCRLRDFVFIFYIFQDVKVVLTVTEKWTNYRSNQGSYSIPHANLEGLAYAFNKRDIRCLRNVDFKRSHLE